MIYLSQADLEDERTTIAYFVSADDRHCIAICKNHEITEAQLDALANNFILGDAEMICVRKDMAVRSDE